MEKNSSNSKTQVKEPGAADLVQMANIFKQGQQPHHERFPGIFGPADNHDAIIQYLRGFLKPRNPFRTRRSFAAGWFVNQELGGYLLYNLYETSNIFYGRDHWVCHVEDIAVDAAARSSGGASMMLDHLSNIINRLDHCIASANVWRDNDASEALFRKFGFDDLSKTYYRVIG